LGLQRRQPCADLLEAAALRKLAERPTVGRDRVGLVPTELLRPTETQQELLVIEILRTEPLQGGLEGLDGFRVVAFGLPRVGDAALAEGPQRPGRALSHCELKGPTGRGILLRLVTEISQLIRHLGSAS